MKTFMTVAMVLCSLTIDGALAADAFTPECLPYQRIAQKNPIDATCGPEGQPTSPAHAKEYIAKNYLCASNPVIDITLDDMIALQQKVAEDSGIPIGQRNTPVSDRTKLRGFAISSGVKVGEVSVVRVFETTGWVN
jgi:hypothetical protein